MSVNEVLKTYRHRSGDIVKPDRIEAIVISNIRQERLEINQRYVSRLLGVVLKMFGSDLKLRMVGPYEQYKYRIVCSEKLAVLKIEQARLEKVKELMFHEVFGPFVYLFVSPLYIRFIFRMNPAMHRHYLCDVAFYIAKTVLQEYQLRVFGA